MTSSVTSKTILFADEAAESRLTLKLVVWLFSAQRVLTQRLLVRLHLAKSDYFGLIGCFEQSLSLAVVLTVRGLSLR